MNGVQHERCIFTCSIDDGHPADLKTAELLQKHGMGATFFIPVKNREDSHVMTGAEIRQLGRQFEIGSHTYDHCYLNYVDIREAYYQIAEGKSRLEDILGRSIHGFCYPGGKYHQRDIELVRACGFQYARTTSNLYFSAGSRPFEMPTTLQFFPHERGVYLRNFVKWGDFFRRQEGLRIAISHDDWVQRLHAMFDHCCEQRKLFHLWWHSTQVEELGAWPVLDAFLAHVASCVRPDDRLNNAQLAERCFHRHSLVTVTG